MNPSIQKSSMLRALKKISVFLLETWKKNGNGVDQWAISWKTLNCNSMGQDFLSKNPPDVGKDDFCEEQRCCGINRKLPKLRSLFAMARLYYVDFPPKVENPYSIT